MTEHGTMPAVEFRNLLEAEHLIGRLKLVELLEHQSPYQLSADRVERRFSQALTGLPENFRHAALAIFATTLYITQPMLDHAWKYLWSIFTDGGARRIDPRNLLILELDRDQLRDEFYRSNALPGRLQDNLPWRSTHDIIDGLRSLASGTMDAQLAESFVDFLRRPTWILLADLSLSGTSAKSELDRLHRLRALCGLDQNVEILALVQVLTDDAAAVLSNANFTHIAAVRIPGDCALANDEYSLIGTSALVNEMRGLCRWFATNHVLPSGYRIAELAREDGDVAVFGYGKRGWNVVTYRNAPNNSLPVLWFRPPDDRYLPPFERIDSRIGQPWPGRRDWLDQAEHDSGTRERIMDAMARKKGT